MSVSGRLIHLVSLLLFLMAGLAAYPQAGAEIQVEKPKKYQSRMLGYEKSNYTRFGLLRRFTQNQITHYNYQFNAFNKLNDVVASARQMHRDNYAELLPFYNYSLEATASQQTELDSVIEKCTTGILLHDLRNDWIDNLYMLMAKAYFYRQTFDTAALLFQYINYQFQERKKDEVGMTKYVGSKDNYEDGQFSISTREKKGVVTRALTAPPSRNDALLWQARTFIEQDSYGSAAGILEILKKDVHFPERLKPQLQEVLAYWYYQQEQWDSAVVFLERALPVAENALERSRWEYLIAQLYEKVNRPDLASEWYDRAAKHTTDLVLEVYARLRYIRVAEGGTNAQLIDENIQRLLKLAKWAKYENYRHIIYQSAARMELQRKRYPEALNLFKKALSFSMEDPNVKNEIFLELQQVAYDQKEYTLAFYCLDSLDLNNPELPDAALLRDRRDVLRIIVENQVVIDRQDSLQKIAALPEAEREALLKKLSRQLKKEKGIKENKSASGDELARNNRRDREAADLFGNSAGGDWYFYNVNQRSRGITEFGNTWGNRPNVDNWRRSSALREELPDAQESQEETAERDTSNVEPFSPEALARDLPLTAIQREMSDDSIATALFNQGKAFKDKLEACEESVAIYETLLERYPQTIYREEVLFDLYYCYTRLGKADKARISKQMMERDYSQSDRTKILKNPQAVLDAQRAPEREATRVYEGIYNNFIEGNYERALIDKKLADSSYGSKYWTPQLLYIEAVYYIKNQDDNTAIYTLQNLINLDPKSPMAEKARTMIDVIKRRKQIEDYLTKANIERLPDDTLEIIEPETPPVAKQEEVIPAKPEPEPEPEIVSRDREKIEKKEITPKSEPVTVKLPPISGRTDSLSRRDTEKASPEGFLFKADDAQYVVIVMDRVDVVYMNETRIAFQRYNRDRYSGIPIDVVITPYQDPVKLIRIGLFADAVTALGYIERARPVAGSEIVPWLPAAKYSFLMISESNLRIVDEKKNLPAYQRFIRERIPGKF